LHRYRHCYCGFNFKPPEYHLEHGFAYERRSGSAEAKPMAPLREAKLRVSHVDPSATHAVRSGN
jgi:hypothetical protein